MSVSLGTREIDIAVVEDEQPTVDESAQQIKAQDNVKSLYGATANGSHTPDAGDTNSHDIPKDQTRYMLPTERYSTKHVDFKSRDPGSWFFVVSFACPLAFIALVFGVLPVQDPASAAPSDWAVFAFATAPLTFGAVSYFHFVAFLFCVQVDRPFRVRVFAVGTIMALVAAMTAVVWSVREILPPKLFGGWMTAIVLGLTWIVLWVREARSLSWEQRQQFRAQYIAFVKVELTLVVFLVILVCYIFAWRFGGETLQRLLPVILATCTFIFRKIILSLTHPFPLEPAMFLSGFWVENMDDMLQVLAFVSVANPSSFLIIWVVPAAGNLANLFFLSYRWFLFRIWVKEFLKRFCTCGAKGDCWDVHEVPITEDDPDERGHSNNLPGYRRRQVRFFIWKLLSQLFAMLFYLSAISILRWGVNKNYFPFNEEVFEEELFENSVVYAAGNTVFIILTFFLGMRYVRAKHKEVYDQLIDAHGAFFVNHKYMGFVIGVVVHNGLLATAVMMQHFQVWFAFGAPAGAGD